MLLVRLRLPAARVVIKTAKEGSTMLLKLLHLGRRFLLTREHKKDTQGQHFKPEARCFS